MPIPALHKAVLGTASCSTCHYIKGNLRRHKCYSVASSGDQSQACSEAPWCCHTVLCGYDQVPADAMLNCAVTPLKQRSQCTT